MRCGLPKSCSASRSRQQVTHIRVTRSVRIPDPIRISRYRKAPELGPRILFFSGGTALNGVSRVLKTFTYNSIHLVTPFDSGGSSANLRQAFSMPSIGDLRSRLMALADETVTGHPEIYNLFTYRFPKRAGKKRLLNQLDTMIKGRHPLLEPVPNPMRRIIRNQLGYFYNAMPAKFDLRGASIGNLILTGGYLNNHEHLDPIIFLFEKLVGVQGIVRAVVNDNYHLTAELDNGRRIIGQHLLTGKEVVPLTSSVRRLSLSKRLDKLVPVKSQLRKKNHKLIQQAELICYPPGSFYSSLIANLLPQGVAASISANDCPKVFIPNLGPDPEQIGMSLNAALQRLMEYLHADAPEGCTNEKLLNFVLIDRKNGFYPSGLSDKLVRELPVQVIETPLISKRSAPFYDSEMLVSALLSLA
ncbi:MAG: GAK system CofD-like protein [Candidatus Thiodiazotropha sp. (ex Epidulcina cf. delphinae)]|nr:GAK system CofD-like protein [Candidatus Thiodiazotropha sp. (ex Epidulcina cf. delphinae)]